jgi:hypothetical protein
MNMLRKVKYLLISFLLIAPCVSLSGNYTGQEFKKPYGLMIEFIREPASTFILDSKPEFSWIIPDEAISQKGYQIIVPDLPGFGDTVEPPLAWEVAEYADFVDNNKVNNDILENIAEKNKNGEPLSDRERAIFSYKTADIEKILTEIKKEEEQTIKDETESTPVEIKTEIEPKPIPRTSPARVNSIFAFMSFLDIGSFIIFKNCFSVKLFIFPKTNVPRTSFAQPGSISFNFSTRALRFG